MRYIAKKNSTQTATNMPKGLLPIHIYALNGDVERLKSELEAGVDPDVKIQGFNYNTALMCTVNEGDLKCSKLLLDYRASPNLENRWNRSPLMHVVSVSEEPAEEMIDLLVSFGAIINGPVLHKTLFWASDATNVVAILERVSTDVLRNFLTTTRPIDELYLDEDGNQNFLLFLKEAKWRS